MDKRVGIKAGLLILTLLLLPLPIIACAPGEVTPPAPAEKVIKVGISLDLTGPYSPAFTAGVLPATLDYVKHVNKQGGINGIRVEGLWTDSRSDPSVAIVAYKRFKEQGIIAMYTGTSSDTLAILSMLEADKIPATGTAVSKGLLVPPGWYFCPRSEMGLMMSTALDAYYNYVWKEA